MDKDIRVCNHLDPVWPRLGLNFFSLLLAKFNLKFTIRILKKTNFNSIVFNSSTGKLIYSRKVIYIFEIFMIKLGILYP